MARGIIRPDDALNAIRDDFRVTYPNFEFAKSPADAQNSAFDIDPAVTQIIQEDIVLSSNFLNQFVDSEVVPALAGEYDRLSVANQLMSTVISDRYGFDPSAYGVQAFQLEEVTSDVAITYTQIAKWYHRPEFLRAIQMLTNQSRAKSYEIVGWWGQTRVADRTASQEPKGKQIATGWLQWLINNLPYQCGGINLATGDTNSLVAYRDDYTVGCVKIGTTAWTNGTGTGYVVDDAGYAIGDDELVVETGTGTIPAGQVITIAGDATATRYTVTTGVAAPGTITIFPPLQGTLSAATHAITLIAPANVTYSSGAIKGQYSNLDALVQAGIQNLIPVEFQDNLTVVVGRGIWNYLTTGYLDTVAGGMDRLASERIAIQLLRGMPNIAGYPVVVADFAPDYLIMVTRLKGGSSMNPLLGNSNMLKLTHQMIQRSILDYPIKSAMIDFMYENLFYGLRNAEATFMIHPDSIQLYDSTLGWQFPTTTPFKLTPA
jgi:hypothetical protein